MQIEEKEWLENNINKYNWKNLTILFNKKFNIELTISGVRKRCEKFNITKNKMIINREDAYSLEQDKWIIDHAKLKRKTLVKKFNDKFNCNKTLIDINNHLCIMRKKYNLTLKREYSIDKIMSNKELIQFINDNYHYYHKEEMRKIIKEKFNIKCSQTKFYSLISKIGLDKDDFPQATRLWSEEMKEIFNKYKDTKSDKEILKIINDKYNKNLTIKAISHYRMRNANPKKYKYQDNKEIVAKHSIGEEMYSKSKNTFLIKNKDGLWVEKKRYLYEKYNKIKLENTDYIIQLDGNINNFEKDNLVKINKYEHLYVASNKWYGYNCNITKAGIEIAKSKQSINELEVLNNGKY